MIILSHRGYWKYLTERNQRIAFERSFNLGFGTETDLRDSGKKIVISHDMPGGNEISFEEVLKIMDGRNLPLALNIKADGLADDILDLLNKYNHTNYFTFVMSSSDRVVHIKKNVVVFTGLSDILSPAVLLDKVAGVWLDSFNSDWYEANIIDDLIQQSKSVCIVSADLHHRDYDLQWEMIKHCKSLNSTNLMICTDYPEKAKEYFCV